MHRPITMLWITSAGGNGDPAILRRWSSGLKLDLPSRVAATHMLARMRDPPGGAPGVERAETHDRTRVVGSLRAQNF